MVIGHCIQFGSGQLILDSGAFFSNPVFKYIYSFHMPLFMLISGYLFHYSIKHNSLQIIIGKIKGIIIPLICWHSLYQFIVLALGNSISLRVFLLSYFHTLWFLRALFVFYMVVLFVNRVFKDNTYIYILVFIISFFIPNHILPDVMVFTFPFFMLGYFVNKFSFIHFIDRYRSIQNNWLFTLIIFALHIGFLHFYKDDFYVYISQTYLLNNKYTLGHMIFINMYRILTAIWGCGIILILIFHLHKHYIHSQIFTFLIKLSPATICVYAINHYINDSLLISLPIYQLNYIIVLIETIIILTFSYTIYIILIKNRILRLLFLGSR